jgi:light-regulated signal transduction histidine kinase (bacteriophytochrome)
MEKSLRSYAEQLKRSNQELEHFAFQASHDLQEPLRKIESFGRELSKIAGAQLDETGQDYLRRMGHAASRMRMMIDDLLTLSRVTSQGLHIEEIDLNQLVRSVIDDLDERVHQARGTVTVEELPSIRADSTQIYLLVQNLVGNALKFHRPNVPAEVKVSSRKLAGNQVEISVQDNGIGFDEQQAQRLFQPFQRLQNRYEYEGTGIGLSICHKIVERCGGSIAASSTPGEGSVFTVILPVDTAAENVPG